MALGLAPAARFGGTYPYPMRLFRSAPRLLALLPALFILGCASTYTVDITNSTRSTIQATLEIESLSSGQSVLAKAVISPGDYRQLGPVNAPLTDRVRISVSQLTGSGGYAERRRLDTGKSFVDVAGDEFGGGNITLSIRRDP